MLIFWKDLIVNHVQTQFGLSKIDNHKDTVMIADANIILQQKMCIDQIAINTHYHKNTSLYRVQYQFLMNQIVL